MQYSILLSALCAASAMAIAVTSPSKDSVWSDSDSNTIKWTSVNTDPSTINIVLVNQHVNPPTSQTIATNVQTSDGSYTVSSLTGTGSNYQVNLVSTQPSNSGILAQSEQFSLQAGSGTTVTVSATTLVSTAVPGSATLTTTVTGSGSVTATTVVLTGSATVTTGTVTVSGTTKASSTGTVAGTVSGTTSGSASGSAASPVATSGAEAKVASLAGVAVAGLFAFFA